MVGRNPITAAARNGGISLEANRSGQWNPNTQFAHGRVAKCVGNRVQQTPPRISAKAIAPTAIDPVATAIGMAGQVNGMMHTALPTLQNVPGLGGALGIAAMVGYGIEVGIGAADHIREIRKSGQAKTAESQPVATSSDPDETKTYFAQQDRQKHRINLLRNLSDITRFNVSISSSIAGFFSTATAAIVSTGLSIASGALGTLVGGVSCVLYGLKARKFHKRLKDGEGLKSFQTSDSEKGRLFKILDELRIDRFRQQRNSAITTAGVYGGIGVLGLLGVITVFLSGGIATAGLVPGLIFTGGMLVWGGYCLVKAIKQYRAQKALHHELQEAPGKLRQKENHAQDLEKKIQDAWANYQNRPHEDESLSKMDRELFNAQDQWREEAKRLECLLEKYLESNPGAAVECLLHLLPSPEEDSPSRLEIKNYFESRCKDRTRFESSFQLLEKQWNSVLTEQQKLGKLLVDNAPQEEIKAQKKNLGKSKKQAIQTACKILGL